MTKIRNQQVIDAFAKRLIELRKARKLTQEDLAFSAGISTTQVSRIECGEVNTTISTVSVLAEALEVKPTVLLDF